MAVSLAFAALALAGVLLSEKPRVWTEVLLESSAGVQHRKAVLAVRRGEHQQAIGHFEAALAGRAGRAAWLDYAAALAKAGRPADLLRLAKRMPDEVRSHPEVLAAVANALVETGEDGAVPGALARLLSALKPGEAQRFEQALHERRFGDAVRALRESLQDDPERAAGLTWLLVGALQRGAVARARAGELEEALAVLEDLVAGKDPSSAAVEADRLVVLCWSGQIGRAVDGFLGLPAGSDAPEYVLDALVGAWGASEAAPALPDDTLSRLLARTRPDVGASLIAGCRSSRQLSHARAALPDLSTGSSERDARRLGLLIDRHLAVLWARDGGHAEAVELLRSVIGRDPADDAGRADLVTILSWAGRHADAAREGAALEGKGLHDYAQRALERSRAALKRERVERRRAELHRKAVECARAGKFPEALRLIAQASAGGRIDAIEVDRAVILSWAGRHEDAVAAFEALTKSKSAPRPPYLLAALASSYNAVGRPDLALALWRKVLENDPKDLVAQEAVLTALVDAERWSDARALLDWLSTRQVATGPLRARLAHRKAVLAGRQGQFEAALKGIEGSAHELEGDLAVAWDRIALLSWSGRHWEAIDAFESLAAPAEAPDYVQLEAAEAYRASYRVGAAFELYAALLAKDRDDARAWRGIRSLLSERADWFFEPGLRRLGEGSEPPPPWLREHRWEDGRSGDAIAAARRGDGPEALRALRLALEAPEWAPRCLRDSLVLLSLSGRFPEVAALFRALSSDGEGLEWLASAALGAAGRPEEALALSLAWCERRPGERGACAEAVHRLLRLDRVAEASGLVARLPLGDAQRLEADLLLHQGRAAEASARYEEALKRSSEEPAALLGLAVALSLQGRDAQSPARAALEQLPVGEYLLHHALTPDAAVALARILNGLRRPAGARAALEPLLVDRPENTDALFALGQALELQQERLEAAQAYGRLLRISPGDRRAAEARDRVLQQLAATGSPGLGRGASDSPGVAHAPRSAEDSARATLASLQGTWASGVAADEAALREAANAHLDLEEHEQALALYRMLAERIEQRGGSGRAEHTEAKLAQVRCLVRLLEFERAGQILEGLERELPLFVRHRGTRVPNWDRADVEVERGWWLLAQDRLSEAESHFARMLGAAPLSAAARSGLAHTHLLRGWPRLARTELQQAAEQHPQDGDIKVGLAQALRLTRDPEGAQRIAEELSASSPDNRHARELMGAMRIASLSEVWASAAADLRFAGAEGLSAALGFRTPVGNGRLTLQADVAFGREESAGSADRIRAKVGARAEVLPDLSLSAQASANLIDRRWGVAATIEYEPTDRLAFHLQGDSDSWALPPGAMRAGVTGKEIAASARYRRDETFEAAADLRGLALDDGNRILEGEARVQLQLAATGRWRSTLGMEAAAEGSRRPSLLYFSPPRTLSAVLVPELEHIWWRSRRYSLRDRAVLSAGLAHEDEWGLGERLALDYEQRHALWERWELMLQAGVSRRRYEGTAELGWRLSLGSRLRF